MPLVSIIIPVHNSEKYLRSALDSVLVQTLTDFEIICVDNCSNDSSPKLLREYAEKDKRIACIFHNKEEQLLKTYRDGILRSSGKYVMFLAPCDFLETDALATACAAITEKGVDAVQFGTAIENYGKLSEQNIKRLNEFFNPSNREAFSDNPINDLFFTINPRLNWVIWNKIYRGDLWKTSSAEVKDDLSCYKTDIYASFIYFYNSKSYSRIDNKLYHHLINSDHTGYEGTGFEKFKASLLSVADLIAIRNFLLSHNSLEDRTYTKSLKRIRQIFISEHFKYWHLLPDYLKSKGLTMLCSAWEPYIAPSITDYTSECIKDNILSLCPNKQTAIYARGTKYIDEWYKKTHQMAANDIRIVKDTRKNKTPRVSVIIPTYNTVPYLEECLNSIKNQTLDDIEVICINDESTDGSFELLCDFAKTDDRFVVCTQSNAGLATTRNRGLEISRGKYVYFLDSDDWIEPNTFSELYTRAEELKLDVLFFEGAEFLDSDDTLAKEQADREKNFLLFSHSYNRVYSGTELLNRMCVDKESKSNVAIQFINREFLHNSDIHFLDGILHEDVFFTIKELCFARRASVLNQIFFHRRLRANSIMTKPTSFANAYGFFCSFIAMNKILGTLPLDAEGESGLKNRMDAALFSARKAFKNLSQEERYSAKGLPLDLRMFFEPCISDWVRENERAEENRLKLKGSINLSDIAYARLDIKNIGADSNEVKVIEISDADAAVEAPKWMHKNGSGIVVKSKKGTLLLRVKCYGDGKLNIALKGADFRDVCDDRIPVWVDYTKFIVDGNIIFNSIKQVYHDMPYKFTMDVKNGQTVDLRVKWMQDVTIGQGINRTYRIQENTRKTTATKNEIPYTVSYARIDIKNEGSAENNIKIIMIHDDAIKIESPKWLQKNGNGVVLKSRKGSFSSKVKCIGNGKLHITLRGADIRDSRNKRIPIWLNYTKFIVNDKTIFDTVVPVWHDKPVKFIIDVKDEQILDIHVEWLPDYVAIGYGVDKINKITATSLKSAKSEIEKLHKLVEALNSKLKDADIAVAQRDAKLMSNNTVIAERDKLLSDIRSGVSFRLGRMLTYIPRKILGRD